MSHENERPSLKEVIDGIVVKAGWLEIIGRVAPQFRNAISHLGSNVDCPFPAVTAKEGELTRSVSRHTRNTKAGRSVPASKMGGSLLIF